MCIAEAGVSVYPASGCRTSSSGGLGGVGTNGYAWSSAPHSASGVSGAYLLFNSSNVYPESSYYRATGFPVRCVQLCVSREQRPFTDFAEAKKSGASNGGVMDKRGRGRGRHLVTASGWRTGWSGGLDTVGTNGFAWSSAPFSASNDGGSYLIFNTSDVYPEGDCLRAFGLPVRCVPDNKSGFQ